MRHPGLINTVIEDKNDLFQWSEKNFAKVQIIIEKYPPERQQSAVIPLLDLAQRQNKGWSACKGLFETHPIKETLLCKLLRKVPFLQQHILKPSSPKKKSGNIYQTKRQTERVS